MKKIEFDELKMLELHESGKTPREISIELGVTESTLRNRLKSYGVTFNRKLVKKTDEILDQIKNLVEQNKTTSEIAKELSISPATVRKYLVDLNLTIDDVASKRTRTLTNKQIELTDIQLEVLYGSLLGDMSIDTNWKNARPIISHGGEQEEYFDHKCEIFKNLIGKISKKDRYDKRTDKWYHKYFVKFLTNPIYTKIKEELYPNGVKTVSQEWLDKITPRGLAFWFMDDGTSSGVIATNSFTYKEHELIQKWFLEKYGIETTIQNTTNNEHLQHLIYIRRNSREKFYNLVKDYFIPSMMYKIENWIQ